MLDFILRTLTSILEKRNLPKQLSKRRLTPVFATPYLIGTIRRYPAVFFMAGYGRPRLIPF